MRARISDCVREERDIGKLASIATLGAGVKLGVI